MRNERDVWNTTFYHRVIREEIGNALSAGYDLSQPLPDRLSTLLHQIDEPTPSPSIGPGDASTTPAFD
jgi:hypothetical protein